MMQLPQLLLAAFCVLLGIVPGFGFYLLQQALHTSRQGFGMWLAAAEPMKIGALHGIAGPGSSALFAPAFLAAIVLFMFLAVYGISRLGQAPRRTAVPWLCGYARESESNRYVAHNYYGEIKRYFGWVGGQPRSMTGQAAKEIR